MPRNLDGLTADQIQRCELSLDISSDCGFLLTSQLSKLVGS